MTQQNGTKSIMVRCSTCETKYLLVLIGQIPVYTKCPGCEGEVMLTPSQIADYWIGLGMAYPIPMRSTVYKWISAGRFGDPVRVPGRGPGGGKVIPASSLAEFKAPTRGRPRKVETDAS